MQLKLALGGEVICIHKEKKSHTPIIALSPQKLMTFLSVNSYGVLLHSIITRFKDITNEPLETTAGSSSSHT